VHRGIEREREREQWREGGEEREADSVLWREGAQRESRRAEKHK